MKPASYVCLVAITVAATACADLTYDPDLGPLHSTGTLDAGTDGSFVPTGLCSDSDPNAMVSFSTHIRPLTTKSPGGCLGCHGGNATSGFSIGSYDSLRRGGQNSGTKIIVPGDPCASLLVQKLGLAPPYGSRMPYNGPPYFNAQELTLVRDWIAEGARNN